MRLSCGAHSQSMRMREFLNLRSAALARCRRDMRSCEAHGHLVWGTHTRWIRNGREAAEAELTRSVDVDCRDDDGSEELDDVDDARALGKVRDETRSVLPAIAQRLSMDCPSHRG